MFVAINNKDMDFLAVDAWINRTRDASENKLISPEFAMEVLSKTNHFANIKKVLMNIKDKCTTREQLAPYKEFILSCVDGRVMSGEALAMLQSMARICNVVRCVEELKQTNYKRKLYGVFDCVGVTIKSIEELKDLKRDDLIVYYDSAECLKINLSGCNLGGVKEIRFKDGVRVDFSHAYNLPKKLDVSMCNSISLHWCDLSGVQYIKFRDAIDQQKYMKSAINFKGKVFYISYDKEGASIMNLGMEM